MGDLSMLTAAIQLTTESLLAWLIVAVGLLGFIIAHTVERWYKAVVPGLLSLGIVALGLYFIVRLMQEPDNAKKPDTGSSTTTEEADNTLGARLRTPSVDETEPLTGGPGPIADETKPAEDLTQYVTASVPELPGNPFHSASEQVLKVTVRVKNTGTEPVHSVTITCRVPYKPDPRRWKDSSPQTFDLGDRPIQPGEETDVVVNVDDISNPADCGRPLVRIDSAS
jgi:hypothetical protein